MQSFIFPKFGGTPPEKKLCWRHCHHQNGYKIKPVNFRLVGLISLTTNSISPYFNALLIFTPVFIMEIEMHMKQIC